MDNFGSLLGALSVLLGLQNLQENREQSAHNDVESANDKQAAYLLEQIRGMFEEQNALLAKILSVLEADNVIT